MSLQSAFIPLLPVFSSCISSFGIELIWKNYRRRRHCEELHGVMSTSPRLEKLAMGLPGTQERIPCLRFLTRRSSSKDMFMVFVKKANASLEETKSSLAASDYLTKTAGAHHTPSAAPVGEGFYAITKAGRETHLAYIFTSPSELGVAQKDTRLQHRGSFVTAAKNTQRPRTKH